MEALKRSGVTKELGTVFVTVGTTKFEKLILTCTYFAVLEALRERGCKELILQIGAGQEPDFKYKPFKISWYRFKPTLANDISNADLIISHAGAGTCLDVLNARKPLIAVVNDDLMDDHQNELAGKFASYNYLACSKPSKLAYDIKYLDVSTLSTYEPGDPSVFASFINSLVGIK